MKKVLSVIIWIASKITGRKNLGKLLVYSAKSINVNLHLHGLIQIGGVSSFNSQINGENYFIKKILCDLCDDSINTVFFDIGANTGGYSLELRKYFSNSEIYCFEPVKSTFDILTKNTEKHKIKLYNVGFSDRIGTGELFNTVGSANTEIASVYKEVFHEIFKKDDVIASIEFKMDTIDNFCKINNITNIDFLKIDVEGHELSVLKGAQYMLANKHIKIIQFEFNSHNVYSRVFLRDFYLMLKDYEFYRVSQNGVIELGPYNSINEIFILQNIIAVRNDVCDLIKTRHLISFYRE